MKVVINIDTSEFRKQFNYLLNRSLHDITEEEEGILNLFGGIRDALEAQGVEIYPTQSTEDGLDKDTVEKISDPQERDIAVAQLWSELEDVPFDITEEYPDGVLADDWAGFKAGTDKYEIWHWFDAQYSVGIYRILCPETKGPTVQLT